MAESIEIPQRQKSVAILQDEMQRIVKIYNPAYTARIKGPKKTKPLSENDLSKHLVQTPQNSSSTKKDIFANAWNDMSIRSNAKKPRTLKKNSLLFKQDKTVTTDEYRSQEKCSIERQDSSESDGQPEIFSRDIREKVSSSIKNNFKAVDHPIDNAISYVVHENHDKMLLIVNNFQIDKPLCTLTNRRASICHIDDICGIGAIETINSWNISLLPNRQIRLEDNNQWYRIRLSKEPTFRNGKVTIEGCLAPGGHLFRLTFDLNISDEMKDQWMKINDVRWLLNENILDYTIGHRYGSLAAIKSSLHITFVHDPKEVTLTSLKDLKTYTCYYSQRLFVYFSEATRFIGSVLIGNWGARSDMNALFFIAEGAPEDGTDYLMAVTSDVVWFRAWKAVIYADFKTSKRIDIGKGDSHTITPLLVDFFAVRRMTNKGPSKKFEIGKFVFDYATREFTSVNFERGKEHFKAHRIIGKNKAEKTDYDFKVFGRDCHANEIIDLQIRLVFPQNRKKWEDAVAISLSRAYAFLDMALKELRERSLNFGENSSDEENPYTFEDLTQLIAIQPKVDVLRTIISTLLSNLLENLIFMIFDVLYRPLVSVEEAETLISYHSDLSQIFGHDRARILNLLHEHIHAEKMKKLVSHSKIKVWRRLVKHYMRYAESKVTTNNYIIDQVAEYFDHLTINQEEEI